MLPLIERYHGYGSLGRVGNVWVAGDPVEVAFAWQPPPYGAAKAVSPGCPAAALSLSRMVAIPFCQRNYHISKPLKWLMKKGIDRTRYPVLVTYADVGQGHCGNVYRCSGWQEDGERVSPVWLEQGKRISVYSGGRMKKLGPPDEHTTIIRFVHRVCEKGGEMAWLTNNGWRRVPAGGVWKSGNPKMKWVRGA